MNRSISTLTMFALCTAFMVTLGACSTAPQTKTERNVLQERSTEALRLAEATDPSMRAVLREARGYAVFPSVGKGAVGVGGAYGRGILYEQGTMVGYCDLSQATIGLQLGGQSYTQIIAFETQDALNRFKSGEFAFSAQATAVAVRSGAGANAKYNNGVAVFTMDEAGLMYEASIGGQKFTFEPLATTPRR